MITAEPVAVLRKTRQPIEFPALAVSLITALFFVISGLVVANELPQTPRTPAARRAAAATPAPRDTRVPAGRDDHHLLPGTQAPAL